MITKIYTLQNPITNEIRYVGKTNQSLEKRLMDHIYSCKRYKHHNSCWIKSLLKKNLIPIIQEVDSTNLKDWKWLEIYWISQFKSWGFNLTNMTDGGDGNNGQIFSKKSSLKRSKSLKGHIVTKETRKKISKKHIGKKLSKETKDKVRNSIIKLQGRKIIQYNLNGEKVKTWKCIKDAAKFYKIDSSSIMRCCKHVFKTSAGYKWEYKKMKIQSSLY